jgi:imidazolonepropionase-like amidohydrolase
MTSPAGLTVIRDVRVFPGHGSALLEPMDVTVAGAFIQSVRPASAVSEVGQGATVIDGGGRTLMPGMIDAHVHMAFTGVSQSVALTADVGFIHLVAGVEATAMLLRGFTSVRDVGGPTFGLKRAIDTGVIPGPRLYPAGAMISQTSGHGDFRMLYDLPSDPCRGLSYGERLGGAAIADGADAVLRAAREQLMRGATHLKVMAGGGVASAYDPIDVTQYTERELRAAVEAAENWGTYVTVHAYTPHAIRQAVTAGVRCIEHGQLIDDETAALLADKGVHWSLQPFLDDEDAIPIVDPASRAKQLQVIAGTDRAYELARKHGVALAWGTDTLFDPDLAARQGKQLAKLTRWFTPAETLTMATSGNAQVLAMSGERNPYPAPLGVIEAGAYADLLLVEGNPLEDIGLIADPANLVVIMKNGTQYKNTLTPPA